MGGDAWYGDRLGIREHHQPYLNDRSIYLAAVRAMDGTTNLCHMIRVRGNPADFNHWAYDGAAGWGWDDVLPYFQKLENQQDGSNPTAGIYQTSVLMIAERAADFIKHDS